MVLLTGHFIAQIVNYPLYAYVVNFSPQSRSRISGSVSSTIATAFSIDEYTQGFTRFVLFEVTMSGFQRLVALLVLASHKTSFCNTHLAATPKNSRKAMQSTFLSSS